MYRNTLLNITKNISEHMNYKKKKKTFFGDKFWTPFALLY